MTDLVERAPVAPTFVAPDLVAPSPAGSDPRVRSALVTSAKLAAAARMHTPSPTLRGRAPAYSVIAECLRVQGATPTRSRLARVFGRDPLHPDAASWYRGALGELEVARILSRLDSSWTVLHAVPVGSRGADIDHVVIGPGGTFTINTKNHGGKKIWAAGSGFLVNGQKLAHIRHSLFEAERAARVLSDVAGTPVAVTPLIVVVDPESLVRKKPDVVVMSSNDLALWLRRRPRMQTDAAIARIVWAAERASTWTSPAGETDEVGDQAGRAAQGGASGQGGASAQDNASAQAEAFAALRSEVETARSRRQAWSLLGATAFLAAVVAAALTLAPFIPEIVSALMGAE